MPSKRPLTSWPLNNQLPEPSAAVTCVTGAGYRGQQPPYDAFWGARYAVVEDPDGNAVGIMSPSDPDRRSMARPPGQSTG